MSGTAGDWKVSGSLLSLTSQATRVPCLGASHNVHGHLLCDNDGCHGSPGGAGLLHAPEPRQRDKIGDALQLLAERTSHRVGIDCCCSHPVGLDSALVQRASAAVLLMQLLMQVQQLLVHQRSSTHQYQRTRMILASTGVCSARAPWRTPTRTSMKSVHWPLTLPDTRDWA